MDSLMSNDYIFIIYSLYVRDSVGSIYEYTNLINILIVS